MFNYIEYIEGGKNAGPVRPASLDRLQQGRSS
jgi:hypothetical protein